MPASAPRPPGGSSSRARIEARSAPVLLRMARMPRLLVPAAVGVLVLVGLLAPAPWGGIALLLVALFLTWMSYLAWPRLTVVDRGLRVVVVALLVGSAVLEFGRRLHA